jgi:hypothetical protein
MPSRRRQRPRSRSRARRAAPILLALVLALAPAVWHEIPVLASSGAPRAWPGGTLSYFDASGSGATVATAAAGWNRSGVHIRLRPAADRAHADVVFVADGERLLAACGRRCLGLSSTIGHPRGGRATVTLNPSITGSPTALSVWVVMHELGHVLGLRHRKGSCSLMNAHAFDDSCTFSRSPRAADTLPCGPAAGDAAAAARLYGRAAETRACR